MTYERRPSPLTSDSLLPESGMSTTASFGALDGPSSFSLGDRFQVEDEADDSGFARHAASFQAARVRSFPPAAPHRARSGSTRGGSAAILTPCIPLCALACPPPRLLQQPTSRESASLLSRTSGVFDGRSPSVWLAPPRVLTSGYVTLGLLTLTHTLMYWARLLLPFLVESVHRDLKISATQLALLTGYGISVTVFVSGLIYGHLADTTSRRTIVVLGLLASGVVTVLTGMTTAFWQLLAAVMVMGVTMGSCSPVALSMIADIFPTDRRSLANAVFQAGAYEGIGWASLTGYAADNIQSVLGWRWAFCVSGTAMVALACIMIRLLNEPPRGVTASAEERSVVTASRPFTFPFTVWYVMRLRTFTLLLIAVSLRLFGGFTLSAFLPLAMHHAHGTASDSFRASFGLWNSMALFTCAVASSIISGAIVDYYEPRTVRMRCIVPAIGAVLAIPFFVLSLSVNDYPLAVLFLFCYYLAAETWSGPAASVVQDLTPPGMTGTATATYLLITNMVGNLAPFIVGWVIDTYGAQNLANVLIAIMAPSFLVSSICFFLASRCIEHDRKIKTQWTQVENAY